MTSLTFYGGVNEIGGNKILLDDDGTRIFLDFGQSFSFGEDYFTSWLKPRDINGLGDYFEFDLLPNICGLYEEEQLENTRINYCEPEIDAIFLSHAHYDHMAHISFVDRKIPIYCGETALKFIKSMETTGGTDFGEHNYKTFRTGSRIRVGSLEIEPVHVDHSIPGAYGFLIHTSKGCVPYTGDLRLHGPVSHMTEEFIKRAKESEPIAMISEGTRVAPEEKRKNHSEKEVYEICDGIISKTKKLVLITHYGRDIDRFMTFYKLCKKNGRKFVILGKLAHLLKELRDDMHLSVPDPLKDDNILVYFKRKKSGSYDDKDYYKWERELMPKMVDCDFVSENQSNLVMYLNFYQFGELIDIRPNPGSQFIHSMSEPFSEEDIEEEIMHNWIKHFGLDFHQVHASGHASGKEIFEIIDEISPKKLFPVHTEHPGIFRDFCRNVISPEKEKEYKI